MLFLGLIEVRGQDCDPIAYFGTRGSSFVVFCFGFCSIIFEVFKLILISFLFHVGSILAPGDQGTQGDPGSIGAGSKE